MAKQTSFVAAMLEYFGKQPGQNNSQFLAEIKALTDADRAYFKAQLATAGYEILAV